MTEVTALNETFTMNTPPSETENNNIEIISERIYEIVDTLLSTEKEYTDRDIDMDIDEKKENILKVMNDLLNNLIHSNNTNTRIRLKYNEDKNYILFTIKGNSDSFSENEKEKIDQITKDKLTKLQEIRGLQFSKIKTIKNKNGFTTSVRIDMNGLKK